MDGNGLHGLQVRILQRAMRMLAPDGRIVYSTCSLNPVENEAVVAAALNSNPEFELVDVSKYLPQLIRRPGLYSWSPTIDRTVNMSFGTYDAYLQSLPEDKRADSKLMHTHWPPSNAETLHLERCMRIYPHLQDTGGFFVAIFERKATHNAVASKRAVEDADTKDSTIEAKRLKLETDINVTEVGSVTESQNLGIDFMEVDPVTPDGKEESPDQHQYKPSTKTHERTPLADPSFKEMPYTFLAPDDPALLACIKQLNLASSFPSSTVLVRNPAGEPVRSLYLTNSLVKSVVLANDYTRMRLMASGTKVITKQEAARGMDTQYRVLGEGLPVVLPYIDPEMIMQADLGTLKTLLQTYYPLCSGSHIVRFLAEASTDATLSRDLVLPLWKSNVSISLMIDKKSKSALSLRLFGEDLTVFGRGPQGRKKNITGPSTGEDAAIADGAITQDDNEDAEKDDDSVERGAEEQE
ncbi:hypothetical protein ID866_7782 [Astraeus odoratus]|nr:hypothetical protein ID866_7782 [Astraeus odoratus]